MLKDLISYAPDFKKGKYKSVAFFVHGRELGEHYQVFHFSWTTNTFEVFDSACKATETADFGALGVTQWQIGEMCTRLKKKFDGGDKTCYATTIIGLRGHTVTNKATGEKLLGIYFRCSSNLELDPEMSASCGEASCMEALALLDPSLKEKPIWTDTHRHRAYVISEWISYIILPPQSAPAPMGMEGDVDFESKMRLLKQVMELDFGSSKEDIFKAVCKGYSCWSSEQCPMCHKTVYNEENIQDLIILCCCGNRSHLSCFQERFAKYKQIPGCTLLT